MTWKNQETKNFIEGKKRVLSDNKFDQLLNNKSNTASTYRGIFLLIHDQFTSVCNDMLRINFIIDDLGK